MSRDGKPAKIRLQIPVTEQQRDILTDAAKRAGSDLNTWSLAHCLRAAGSQHAFNGPIVINGSLAERVMARARDQGTTPDRLVELWLVASEAV